MISRTRLIERLDKGLPGKLTLISAPAGFGKTTLVSEWIAGCTRPVAWLSLDEGDNDLVHFITYLVLAFQTIQAGFGGGLLTALQSPEPPSTESILTALLNEIAAIPDHFVIILDDYHLVDSQPVDRCLAFLLEHTPPQMHLVITTREDPSLPLARYRARGQLTELRAVDLRFTSAEAAEFLHRVMGLNLSEGEVAALEARTEGWIAGLQMAAISMQGLPDAASFIQSFTGSHRFVLDYLLEEVLQRQPVEVQTFLMRTSILERLCGALCEAVLASAPASGQETLEYLERANLFIVPLDNERCWYRYHHLLNDLLRKRLGQNLALEAIAELHLRASQWYEKNDLMLEAFRHAAAANAIESAERLMNDKRMPIHIHGVATTVLNWLESLPGNVLNARPGLWWKQASLMLGIGQIQGVEEKLHGAEAALDAAAVPGVATDDMTRDLIGKIAVSRATLALARLQVETILVQASRALEYLLPDDASSRSTAFLMLGIACYFQEDREAAGRAYAEALSLAQAAGDIPNVILALTRQGQIRAHQNQLYQAAETYQQVLELICEYSPSNAAVAYISLARIHYEWNDLETTEKYLEQGLQLARQYDQLADRVILGELYLARLKLARGDVIGAANTLSQLEQKARQNNIPARLQDLAFLQARIHLRQGDSNAAVQMARQKNFTLIQARALIAQGKPSAALEVVEPLLLQQAKERCWADRLLEVMAVQSIALYVSGEKEKAVAQLSEALAAAEAGGFIRLFLDEGPLMAELLSTAAAQGIQLDYVNKLLTAFAVEPKEQRSTGSLASSLALADPLTPREVEVLRLIASGLSNQEIGARLFLALDTVKGHNRRIFEKLQVQRRTEAIARARELGLI